MQILQKSKGIILFIIIHNFTIFILKMCCRIIHINVLNNFIRKNEGIFYVDKKITKP